MSPRQRAPLPAQHRGRPPAGGDRDARRAPGGPAATPGRYRLDFTGERGERLRQALSSVQDICPEFRPAQLLRHSAQSVLLAGSVGRRAVVAKCAVRDSAVERVRREIAAYRIFVRHRPPVRVPRLLGADSGSGTLVQEFVPGPSAASRRYPSGPLTSGELRAVFTGIGRLTHWQPPEGSFAGVVSYPALLQRHHAMGLLTDRDIEDLKTLLHGLRSRNGGREPRQFCHGAAFPAQVVLSPAGPALFGWSAAGWYLPGRDLATLWLALADSPAARRRISQTVHLMGADHRDAFLVNLMLILTREIRKCEEEVQRAMRAPSQEPARAGALAHGEEQRLLLRRLHEDCGRTRGAVRTAVGTR